MKKKIFALMLIFTVIFTGNISSYALESGVTTFSITSIRANFKDKYIKVNITVPKTVSNGRLLVAFYDENHKLLSVTPLDISTKTSFKNLQINAYEDPASGTDYIDRTPEIIEIYTWNKNNLAPKTLCDNVLTPKVIKEANADVVESLRLVPEATAFIRDNHLTWEEDVLEGKAETWDTHLFPIMDYIDLCAEGALEDAEDHLVTSLYAQERFKTELSNIRRLFNTAPKEQKEKIAGLLDATALGKEYYTALNNSMKFLDFNLTEI